MQDCRYVCAGVFKAEVGILKYLYFLLIFIFGIDWRLDYIDLLCEENLTKFFLKICDIVINTFANQFSFKYDKIEAFR